MLVVACAISTGHQHQTNTTKLTDQGAMPCVIFINQLTIRLRYSVRDFCEEHLHVVYPVRLESERGAPIAPQSITLFGQFLLLTTSH